MKTTSQHGSAADDAEEPRRKAGGRRRRDRAGAEQALMEAALRLMDRDGILVGVNMQEVADEAGVNRGLIHHYFGSRRSLLRAAVERGVRLGRPTAIRRRRLEPEEKGPRQFWDYVRDYPQFPRLIALLALDGDETVEPLIFAKERLEDFERERATGRFAADVDLEALMTAWDAALIGYSIIRVAASNQLGVAQRELDKRVLAILGRQAVSLREHR